MRRPRPLAAPKFPGGGSAAVRDTRGRRRVSRRMFALLATRGTRSACESRRPSTEMQRRSEF